MCLNLRGKRIVNIDLVSQDKPAWNGCLGMLWEVNMAYMILATQPNRSITRPIYWPHHPVSPYLGLYVGNSPSWSISRHKYPLRFKALKLDVTVASDYFQSVSHADKTYPFVKLEFLLSLKHLHGMYQPGHHLIQGRVTCNHTCPVSVVTTPSGHTHREINH